MNHRLRRLLAVSLGATAAAFLPGCREDAGDAAARKAEAVVAQSTGLTYLRRDQLPEAEAEFEKVVALAPRDPIGYANLALTHLRGGRYADAEAQLHRARKLAPASVEVQLMMAKLYSLTGRAAQAREVLNELPRGGADDARVLYALAELEAQAQDGQRYEELLRQVLALKPANLAVRLQLLDLAVRRREADSAVRQLEEVRRLPPAPPNEATPLLEETIQFLRAGRLDEARASLDRFLRIMEVTSPYQVALNEVKWVEGPLIGRPLLTFEPQSLITLLGSGFRSLRADTPRFVDATSDAGFPEPRAIPVGGPSTSARSADATVVASGDLDGDGTDDLFVSSRLYHVQGGYVVDVSESRGLSLSGDATLAAFADFDNDGWLDLFTVGADGQPRLLRNTGSGKLEDVTAKAGHFDTRGARIAVFVDIDHDGDLDLLLAGTENRLLYRNKLDGTFTESAESMGIAGRGDARSVRFADFDGDGRIDVFITHADGSDLLYRNAGGRRFADATAASGLATPGGSGAAAVGDYDNDGMLDIFVSRVDGGEPALWRHTGDGTFTRDLRSSDALQRLRGVIGSAAEFVDVDNDGWLDLVVVGMPAAAGGRGVFLFRNDGSGKFEDHSDILPPTVRLGTTVVVSDVDNDGDQDLVVGVPGGVRLLRNEGGNARLATRIQLVALRTGSGKNNSFGIGAKLELRSGEIYQTRVVTGQATHFGLGPHLKADVLRIEWPNGVPRTVHFPGTDQDVLELERLKGSCAFLYAWDGKGFRFVTDVMWRSALGMPLGIMGGGTGSMAYAPAGASQEYLRIPGSALQPKDGRYVLQFTEELWENAYADQIKLFAVDHPDSVEVFVDERFVPPAPVELRLFKVVRPRPPLSATDQRGNDVLPALRERDDVYVSNLTPVQYQGLVEPHDLILDLGEDAGRAGTFLFLRGWIYPTDASINVALSQQSELKVMSPRLEVRDAKGQWTTAIANIGFPSGKDKTIVIDLTGKFPTSDHRVRIRTNMQIYWDQAFVSSDVSAAPVRITELQPVSADLHFRGYSRMYRRGGRYGPHWFDYDDVSREHPWRPIEGAFTRYGDVLPLLRTADDMYVIMAPGDEVTMQFDAASAKTLLPGWKRDFLLYTDGWIKDADLNTAFGNTVEPLPFHGIEAYPYAPGESYPADSAHQRYLREYNTRIISRRR
ncbi:MAG: FG-GAP-like repeat-containing protein [Gemmatimonadota bacterium]|nr:FG-GAP-like repeat-containing protein [Gemmatimonadota bacterium]